jgi:hypothetical protein
MVDEAERYHKVSENDKMFWPSTDEETRKVTFSWAVADALKRAGTPPEVVYAWVTTGLLTPEWGHFLHEKLAPDTPPLRLKKPFAPLTGEELVKFDQATQEYRAMYKQEKPAIQEYANLRVHCDVPVDKQWVLVHKLENGQTSVMSLRGFIDVQTYEQARDFLNIQLKPGTMGYSPDGFYGSAELWGPNVIHCVGWEAVPRSDYNPKKHDTFHLKLGPVNKSKAVKASLNVMQSLGLAIDIQNPSTAFDVMDSLCKKFESGHVYDAAELIRRAHPIVWTPEMELTAYQAVSQLKDRLTVEADVMFLNPVLWLYAVPVYEGCQAEHATLPYTDDGHIPFPDEIVGDLGSPIVAILFNLTDKEILAHYFYLIIEDPPRIEERHSQLLLGSQPDREEQQVTLKHLRFAASPYLIVQRHAVERHVRRRVESRFPEAGSTGVGIILLRRAVSVYGAKSKGNGEIEWACQWWVSGHWTHQPWGPEYQYRRLTWIAPYIKGPPDKPVKQAVRLLVR